MHGLVFRLSKHYVSRAESSRVGSASDKRTEPMDNIQLAHPTEGSIVNGAPSLASAVRFFLYLCVAAEFASEDVLCPLRTAMCCFD